jgi:N-acyl-D-aspartate/D-glutamate deacylase
MRFLLLLMPSLLSAQTYDIVLQRGRVMDPESGLDAVRSIGINGKKIVAISIRPLRGKVEVDASGLVVAPGFIDLHQHSQTPQAYGFKAMDGVTTALELEVGVSPVSEWYAARENKTLINFGASSGHIPARMAVMHDTGGLLPRDAAMNRPATPEEQKVIEAAVGKGLDEGALGLGMGITYTPTASPDEILSLFYLAAKFKRPVFVHMRAGNVIASLQEVIADAAAAGASFFDAGWQEQQQITYSDLLWPATGERLNPALFDRYRKQGGTVVLFSNSEEMIRVIVAHPLVMIASDGILEDGVGHPRAAGTYARLLGKYVREEKALTLMEAIRKSSLMPARRLETMSSQMRQKGRLKVGADADISVFEPNRVVDKATFENPAQHSEGFRYVIVNGTLVVRDGKLQDGVAPGQGIRAE